MPLKQFNSFPKVSKTVYKVSNVLKAVQNLQGYFNCPNTFHMLLK